MSSIKDALRVIAAEKRIEELGRMLDEYGRELDELVKRVAELGAQVNAMFSAASQPRPAQTPQPRPVERR